MAQSMVRLNVTLANAAAVQSWLANLGADVAAGKVETYRVSATPDSGSAFSVTGELVLSAATSVQDLTAAVEDAE